MTTLLRGVWFVLPFLVACAASVEPKVAPGAVTGVAPLVLPSSIPVVLPSQHSPISPSVSLQSSKTISTILAGGNYGRRDGVGEAAQFGHIRNMVLDAQGNLVMADPALHVIRRVTMEGDVSTIAGTGRLGHIDGELEVATFSRPRSVAIDGQGAMYVSDTGNDRLRKISAQGRVLTLTRTRGWFESPQEGLQYDFYNPSELAVAEDGTVYVADESKKIFKVTPEGQVSVFFDGPGTLNGATRTDRIFYRPGYIMLEPDGRLLVADDGNHCIWRIGHNKTAERVLGGDHYDGGFVDGDRSVAKCGVVKGMTYDPDGTLYFGDSSSKSVRKFAPNGAVTTLIGDGNSGDILGIATEARLSGVEGVVVGKDGNLYVADAGNHRILKLSPI